MILDVYLLMITIAFILFIMGIILESSTFSGVSLFLWLIIAIESFNIIVPGDTVYTEWGLNAFALVFVFINLINIIVQHFDLGRKPQGRR